MKRQKLITRSNREMMLLIAVILISITIVLLSGR